MKFLQTTLYTVLVGLALATPSVFASELEYIDIAPKTSSEIKLVLDTLESAIVQDLQDVPPIVMMLHGDEANKFLRNNYDNNKSIIDQTAKLAAYKVIDVKICATWMRMNDYDTSDLFPFVSTVPFGEAEIERLASDEGYEEYTVSM